MLAFEPPYFRNEKERNEWLEKLIIRVKNFYNAKLTVESEDMIALEYYVKELNPAHRLHKYLEEALALGQKQLATAQQVSTQ